jgi:[ribosomal protein S18]-alanine N-acetyltransferase
MLEFRALSPLDVPSLLPLEQRAHAYPWSEAVLVASFGERYRNVGAWAEGRLIGFYIADSLLDESTLHNLCVDPDYQGRGWGRALLAHYLQQSAATGSSCWWLEVRRSNLRAQGLYLQAGYRQIGIRKGYYRAGAEQEDALVMQRGTLAA